MNWLQNRKLHRILNLSRNQIIDLVELNALFLGLTKKVVTLTMAKAFTDMVEKR
ncbi:hypothetical protein [Clostridium thermarum]|uniref:hypothetical protein n=1 Tax=Clostridium thermarum TaxID=1716543 RepID=UPI0013D0F1F7|nr:hypothetical protein [Clostridium thermarum]